MEKLEEEGFGREPGEQSPKNGSDSEKECLLLTTHLVSAR